MLPYGWWRNPGRHRLFPSVPNVDDPDGVSGLIHDVKKAIGLDDELPGWAPRKLADVAMDEWKFRNAEQRRRKFTFEPLSLDSTSTM
jgi:hypothetical protein